MKDEILNLRDSGKTYKEISEILNCSISTISYHCNNNQRGTQMKLTSEIISKIKDYYKTHTINETAKHLNISNASVKKYCDKKRKILSEDDKKKNRVIAVTNRRRKIKQMAVDYKGGKCIRCGYNKYIGALEFHHVDPTQKDFSLGAKGHCNSWEKVKKELDKCILVCSNCHSEIHEELRNS